MSDVFAVGVRPPASPHTPVLTGRRLLGCPFRRSAGLRMPRRVAEAGAGAALPGSGGGVSALPPAPRGRAGPTRRPRARPAARSARVRALHKTPPLRAGARGVSPMPRTFPAERWQPAAGRAEEGRRRGGRFSPLPRLSGLFKGR